MSIQNFPSSTTKMMHLNMEEARQSCASSIFCHILQLTFSGRLATARLCYLHAQPVAVQRTAAVDESTHLAHHLQLPSKSAPHKRKALFWKVFAGVWGRLFQKAPPNNTPRHIPTKKIIILPLLPTGLARGMRYNRSIKTGRDKYGGKNFGA